MNNESLMRLAVWSGPRNLSTAMMRSWENRQDTCVVDEPLYAHYLEQTGIDHPMADQVIASQSTDWEAVTQSLQHESKPGFNIYYQKHISTHMLPNIPLDWCESLTNCMLIRSPERMVASYAKKRAEVNARDLGYEQQLQLFRYLEERNQRPTVVDTDRFLKNPEVALKQWCSAVGTGYDEAMLNWPAGARASDGIWGEHWYDAVQTSTGFKPTVTDMPILDKHHQSIADECREAYEVMLEFAMH